MRVVRLDPGERVISLFPVVEDGAGDDGATEDGAPEDGAPENGAPPSDENTGPEDGNA